MDQYQNRVVGHVDGNDELYEMSGEQVRTLARLIHLQEAQNVRNMAFRSANHRVQYLLDSRRTYESAVDIIDSLENTKSERNNNEEHSKVQEYLYRAASSMVGTACRLYWSLHLREKYLKSLKDFALEKKNTLNEILNNTALTQEDKLVQYNKLMIELAEHKQVSLNAMRSHQNPSGRNFARFWRKLTYEYPDNMFQHIVVKYRRRIIERRELEIDEIGPEEEVEFMPDNAEVFDEILASSGMPSFPNLVKVAKGASRALIVFQLGMIVWDVVESKHRVRTLAKDTTTLAASLGAGLAGEIGATWLLGAAGVATTTIIGSGIVFVASMAAGFGLALLAGAVVGWTFAKLFHSEEHVRNGNTNITVHPTAEHSVVHVVPHHPSTEHLMVHFAPHVDGERLARQITAASG